MDATLLFDGELVGLLHRPAADGRVVYPVTRRASIKDVIEALGPPHTEVYRLAADGREVDFSARLAPGMTVTVQPKPVPVDVTRPTVLRPTPLSRLAFAADANVGRLATLLRLLGYDTTYDRTISDTDLAAQAAAQGRIVLSRDRNCLKRSQSSTAGWCGPTIPWTRSETSSGSSTSPASWRRFVAACAATANSSPWTRRPSRTACNPRPGAITTTSPPVPPAAASTGPAPTTTA